MLGSSSATPPSLLLPPYPPPSLRRRRWCCPRKPPSRPPGAPPCPRLSPPLSSLPQPSRPSWLPSSPRTRLPRTPGGRSTSRPRSASSDTHRHWGTAGPGTPPTGAGPDTRFRCIRPRRRSGRQRVQRADTCHRAGRRCPRTGPGASRSAARWTRGDTGSWGWSRPRECGTLRGWSTWSPCRGPGPGHSFCLRGLAGTRSGSRWRGPGIGHLLKGRRRNDYACCLLVGCLTSQQHASVSQGRICTDNFTCCHTEIEVADQTFYLTQSQYTDTGPTSPSADPITPGAWQGNHWSANFWVTGMTRPRKIPAQAGFEPGIFRSRGGRLNH